MKSVAAYATLFLTSKHGTDLFQIIHSVKKALFKNVSEFQDVSVREFQFDEKLKNGGWMPMIVEYLH